MKHFPILITFFLALGNASKAQNDLSLPIHSGRNNAWYGKSNNKDEFIIEIFTDSSALLSNYVARSEGDLNSIVRTIFFGKFSFVSDTLKIGFYKSISQMKYKGIENRLIPDSLKHNTPSSFPPLLFLIKSKKIIALDKDFPVLVKVKPKFVKKISAKYDNWR